MSMQYCHDCDKLIDTDFDAEHFEEHEQEKEELRRDHVQADVDEQMRQDAIEMAEANEYHELHPRPEDVY